MIAHGPNPNAAAPQPLRFFLDVIDMLGRLDGWMGAACLVALTCLPPLFVDCRRKFGGQL